MKLLSLEEDAFYCHIGAALCFNRISYDHFLTLRRYDIIPDAYINPGDRILCIPLVLFIIQDQASCTNVSWLFSSYLGISHIHSHYDESQQLQILEILKSWRLDGKIPAHRMETML